MPMPTGRELALIKALQCKCGIKTISGNCTLLPEKQAVNLIWGGDLPCPVTFFNAAGTNITPYQSIASSFEGLSYTFQLEEEAVSFIPILWLPDGGFDTLASYNASTLTRPTNETAVPLSDFIFGNGGMLYTTGSNSGYIVATPYYLHVTDNGNYSYTFTLSYIDENSTSPILQLTSTTCKGTATTQNIDLSCLLDSSSGSSSSSGNFVHLTNDEVVDGGKYLTQGPYYKSSALGSIRPAYIIDLNDGSVFTYTAGEHIRFRPFEWYSNDGITVPHTTSASITLILNNGGMYGVEWPENVHWANDTPPQLSTQATDVIDFITADGGTTWYGSVRIANSNQQTLS